MNRLFLSMILIVFLFLPSCQNIESPKDTQMRNIANENITTNAESIVSINLIREETIDHITKIKVEHLPFHLFDDVEITDSENIANIANYLNDINPFETQKNAAEYVGSGCSIEISYDDGVTSRIWLYGNMFITVDDRSTQELSYDEASYFDVVIGDILINQYRAENKENIIIGEVLSVSSEQSGHNISCEIKMDDGRTIEVDVNASKIIDITSSGWLILHTGDKVEIGLKDTDRFIADIVFITQSAM